VGEVPVKVYGDESIRNVRPDAAGTWSEKATAVALISSIHP
jgi:hypothetical protein